MTFSRTGLVLAISLGLLAVALALLVEVVPETSEPHWSPEALRNPYLAAGRLLEKQGMRVEFRPQFSGPPAGPGTLFLARYNGGISPGDAARLRDWVQQGNRLILTAPAPASQKVGDALLGPLGAQRRFQMAKDDPRRDRRLQLGDEPFWLETGFSPGLTLESSGGHPVDAWRDSSGVHVLRYPLGRGVLIVLSDAALFENRQIGRHDNAALLWALLDRPAPGQSLWIVHDGQFPGILALIWRDARPLVLSLAVLALALLWRGNARFGPLLPSPDQPRRRLSEHLQAAGRYLWYAGQQPRLYQAARQGLLQHLFRRHALWRHLDDTSLLDELARHTGLPVPVLQRALLTPPDHDLARFLQDMRVLHQLRKQT